MKYARLLIADAHQNMLEAVRRLLRGLFDVVVMVADGDSLTQVSAAVKPDLIIVDLSLPVSGMGNALRHLRLHDSLPPAKVIALSIHDEVEAVREAFAAGAMGFVLKRAAATDLVPAVAKVLQNDSYVSPGVQAVCQPSDFRRERDCNEVTG
ncbi:MAG: response regulator transcription factor [Planctomycetes bacterium]|nr:response regulator transcription factor [Planctomycetota bacterium]